MSRKNGSRRQQRHAAMLADMQNEAEAQAMYADPEDPRHSAPQAVVLHAVPHFVEPAPADPVPPLPLPPAPARKRGSLVPVLLSLLVLAGTAAAAGWVVITHPEWIEMLRSYWK